MQLSVSVAEENGWLVNIRLHSPAELDAALSRVESMQDASQPPPAKPVVFVLHGAEVKVLLQPNYRANKVLVDRAARLSALGRIDIQVCETWLDSQGLGLEDLQPFVKTVPYGPDEVRRLLDDESYLYF